MVVVVEEEVVVVMVVVQRQLEPAELNFLLAGGPDWLCGEQVVPDTTRLADLRVLL